jgi:hypothetical protein
MQSTITAPAVQADLTISVADAFELRPRHYNVYCRALDARVAAVNASPALRNRVLSAIEVELFGYATHPHNGMGQNRSVADTMLCRPLHGVCSVSQRDAVIRIIVEATNPAPEPTPTPEPTADEAVAAGRASVLPTVDGKGLTVAERKAVSGAIHRAILAAGDRTPNGFTTITPAAREAGRVAGAAALAAVLALRPAADAPTPAVEPTEGDRRWFAAESASNAPRPAKPRRVRLAGSGITDADILLHTGCVG